jgi:D-galacturonate reductase
MPCPQTFKAWAGKSSDISYYLNSHHIDQHAWQMAGRGRPVKVVASAATGVASSEPYNCPKGKALAAGGQGF